MPRLNGSSPNLLRPGSAYQAVLVPEKSFQDILDGKITAIVRVGDRTYQPAQIALLCNPVSPWCVMATITSVIHLRLEEVVKEEWRSAGYESRQELKKNLKIEWLDPVTVIRWKNVRGTLELRRRKQRKSSQGLLRQKKEAG